MSRVRTGLECLLEDDALLARLRSSRVGLLVNPTAVPSNLVHAIDALQARGVTIDILFGPEHGVRAEAQDMEAVEAELDPISGIRAVSLYGHTFASLELADGGHLSHGLKVNMSGKWFSPVHYPLIRDESSSDFERLDYDAVVVGGGAAGGVAARGLAQAGRLTVLVERGPSDAAVPAVQVRTGFSRETFASEAYEPLRFKRGEWGGVANVLGGGTALNQGLWVEETDEFLAEFAHHMHVMGCGYDCHSHGARALNLVKYMGCACHNKVALAFVIFFFGRHVSWRAVLKVWLPPVVIAALAYLVILV